MYGKYSQHDDRFRRGKDYHYHHSSTSRDDKKYHHDDRREYNDDRYDSYSDKQRSHSPPRRHYNEDNDYYDRKKRKYNNKSYDNQSSSYSSPPSYHSPLPEENEEDKNKRTIHLTMLPSNATEQDLAELLKQANLEYKEIVLKKDPMTGLSKGEAYVIFNDFNSLLPALELNGKLVRGFPIIVKQLLLEEHDSKKRTNNHFRNDDRSNAPSNPFQGSTKLYVGNVPTIFNQKDLINLFRIFGYVERIDMKRDENGKFNGIALVIYQKPESARRAVLRLNNLSLTEKYTLKVGFYNENAVNEYKKRMTSNLEEKNEGNVVMDRKEAKDDYYENIGGTNKASFAERFSTLFASPMGEPSQNVKFNNMFNPFDCNPKVVEDNIRKACKSLGNIVHINVDLNDPNGSVYIRFDNMIGAQNATQRLPSSFSTNERKVTSRYIPDSEYFSYFAKD
ncbi:hypothetical protein ABK040_016098 [Willaertia magna]